MEINLYIDTSEHLILGLLDTEYNWVEYLDTEEKKGSGIIHGIIHEMLSKNNFEIKDIKNIFMLSGPGSYTGMRLGEGVAQVLELDGKVLYSTYHFDLPFLIGVERGAWFSRAFKGEIFICHWEGEKQERQLILESELEEKMKSFSLKPEDCFTHVPQEPFKAFKSTNEIVEKNISKICKYLKDNKIRKDPYYYRPLEKEFKQTAL